MQPKFHRKEHERDLHNYLLGSRKDDSQCNWCRKLTPHLRSAWGTEHILGKEEIFSASRYFGEVRVEGFFHLATLGAVPFRNFSLFAPVLKALQTVDTALLRLPWLKRQSWMAVFVLGQPLKLKPSA